jgi:hypothetical protein
VELTRNIRLSGASYESRRSWNLEHVLQNRDTYYPVGVQVLNKRMWRLEYGIAARTAIAFHRGGDSDLERQSAILMGPKGFQSQKLHHSESTFTTHQSSHSPPLLVDHRSHPKIKIP